MIKFFQKIRRTLLKENKFNKYLLYAIGEIILVVIGILIALQVNNWNIAKSNRTKEVKYLQNIVLDLEKNLTSLNYLIEFRKGRMVGDQAIISSMHGEPVNDMTVLTKMVVNSLMEERFTPNNSTFIELASSGNLSLISNDSIKSLLLELNELYKINEFGIAHEEYDYREYISKPFFRHTDIGKLTPVFYGEKTVEEQQINLNDFAPLFENQEYQNGLVILVSMHPVFIQAYQDIIVKSAQIMELIKVEITN